MNFDLNENQKMFRDMVRDFAKKEIAPIAQQMDEEGTMPDELISKMAANGFFGLSFPEQYGGLGVDRACPISTIFSSLSFLAQDRLVSTSSPRPIFS